jgi:hypothetical protein
VRNRYGSPAGQHDLEVGGLLPAIGGRTGEEAALAEIADEAGLRSADRSFSAALLG